MKKKDSSGIKYGMWLFLYSEIMLFTGLFILYAAYFNRYQQDFIHGGKELSLAFGAVNTLILLTSSFTVAASITALRSSQPKTANIFIGISISCGLIFLVNKYFEWGAKISHDIYPGSETLLNGPKGENIFFGLYYVVTGLHGLHIVAGLSLLLAAGFFIHARKLNTNDYVFLENAGLYWHLVDLIWIFIFPLFYLVL